jgi:hypothetical protein
MHITEAQRFIYILSLMLFVTLVVLAALNVYDFEIFIAIFIVEFLLLMELTRPIHSRLMWRKNMIVFMILCAVIFVLIAYTRIQAMYF